MSRILFATTNGTGLGHLTRGMAIARRLPPEVDVLFLTLSQAMPVVAREGFYAEFLFSYDYGGLDYDVWNAHYARRLSHLLTTYQPDVVVFDGVTPYRGLVRAMQQSPATAFVWCRRAMWKAGSNPVHLRNSGLFSAILEPGDYAEDADAGPTVPRRHETVHVDPVVYLDREELVDRQAAARHFGLDPGRPAVLVQLGSGSVSSIQSTAGMVVDRLLAVPDLQVTVAESVIAGRLAALPERVHRARTYPLARYAAAFDFAVAAPGYNLFHEALAYQLPTLFVPKQDAQRDDQSGRAAWAARQGHALMWDPTDPTALDAALGDLLDAGVRATLQQNMAKLPEAAGARQAAEWLSAPPQESTVRPQRGIA